MQVGTKYCYNRTKFESNRLIVGSGFIARKRQFLG